MITDMSPWEVLYGREGDGDHRVEMGPGDVTDGEDDDHDNKAGGEGHDEEGLRFLCVWKQNGYGCGKKYEH